MQSKSFLGHSPLGFHNIAYTEWGDNISHPPLICVHGLMRNGRDFDKLAGTLQSSRKVFCPDIVGRGKSDWLSNPDFYGYPQYVNDMTAMIARTNAVQIDWVGTSMGGIIGMMLAADAKNPIRRLVINDVGPFIPLDALQRIGAYASITPEFDDLLEVDRYLRKLYAPFGITDDADWRAMAENSSRKLPNDKYTLARDPGIAKAFTALDKPVEFWGVYDRIQCPVLLIHGEQSDILPASVADEMTKRGPKAKRIDIPNTGHAPALMSIDQIKLITDFLS